jgi:hypothetical protein
VNVLDLRDLKKGEVYSTYAYRLLDRRSTRPLRLTSICWTGDIYPYQEPSIGRDEEMKKVGFPRRWPLITRVERAPDGPIAIEVEGESKPRYLLDGDLIAVEIA